jgi:transcriptional regulator with AAA-type ATPase domain
MALRGTGSEAEVFFVLRRGINILGSDPTSALQIGHEGVSRRHAALVFEASGLQVIDQRSKNGTFVNGQRVLSAVVRPGDELSLGPVILHVLALDADDAELALELPDAEARVGSGRQAPRTTEVVDRPADLEAERWVDALRRSFLLWNDPARGAGEGLAVLVDELEAEGAMVVERCGGATTVLSSGGAVSSGDLAAGNASFALVGPEAGESRKSRGGEPGGLRFVCGESSGAELWVPGAGAWLGLVVAGDFRHRRDCRQYLLAFLTLYRELRYGAFADPSSFEEDSGGDLHFPDGYVAGSSVAARSLHAMLSTLAAGDLPVLLTGETGVGKEVVARILHRSSPRRKAPFVAINCAAIPADLLEAELFGIGKGVATGVAPRRGKFALAAGGTLFLDEIGEMPRELQAKLLRALQEKEIQPLGEQPVALDVRILAATNVDISDRLEDGSFRRDLFYRLAGFELRVPPLRQRWEDIPAFVESFLRRFATGPAKTIRGVSRSALAALQNYPWPGNVRELEHEIRRLVQLCPSGQAVRSSMLSPKLLVPAQDPGGHPPSPAPLAVSGLPTLDLARLEALALEEALRRTAGNQAAAAKLLGISRFALRRRIERHEL